MLVEVVSSAVARPIELELAAKQCTLPLPLFAATQYQLLQNTLTLSLFPATTVTINRATTAEAAPITPQQGRLRAAARRATPEARAARVPRHPSTTSSRTATPSLVSSTTATDKPVQTPELVTTAEVATHALAILDMSVKKLLLHQNLIENNL